MNGKCYAAIDIGSNAVRLLIKKVKEDENLVNKRLSKAMLLRVPLRLGFDVFALGGVSDVKAVKLRRLMKAFRQLMKIYEVTDYRACATSAMRDAKNGKSIIKKILKDTGINIEVIDGQEEARMIYNNHIECLEDRMGNYIYVDVGGGSTEINLLTNGELVQSLSYNIGTVRMLSNAVKAESWQQMKDDCNVLRLTFRESISSVRGETSINCIVLPIKRIRRNCACPFSLYRFCMTNCNRLLPNSVWKLLVSRPTVQMLSCLPQRFSSRLQRL